MDQKSAAFFECQTILITGASGYLASNLARQLSKVDCRLFRLTRNIERLEKLEGVAQVQDVEGQLQDSELWNDVISSQLSYYKKFHRLMLNKGYYLPPSPYETLFISSVHTKEDISGFVHTACEAIQSL